MNRQTLLYIGLSVAVIAAVVIGVVYLTAKAEWRGTISAFDWRREWDKDRYQMVGGKCWYMGCEPDRAYNISRRSEVHHYDTIQSGQDCTTDSEGRTSCQTTYTDIPVYEWRIYYTVNDWRHGQTLVAAGNTNKTADLYWPDLGLNECDPELVSGVGTDDPMLGCERPAAQREYFYVSIAPENADILPGHCSVPFASWSDMTIGQAVSGSYWYHQNLIDCGDLHW